MTTENPSPRLACRTHEAVQHANALPDEGESYDSACTAMQVLERQIFDTPVPTRRGAGQAQMAAAIHAEGMMLDADAAAELISEVTPYLAGEK